MHREEVDGTPFYIVGNEELGYAITFGKYRLGELRKTIPEALQDLIDQHWNITARLAGVIAEITLDDRIGHVARLSDKIADTNK